MAGTIEQKLAAQGVVLHEPASPVANYVGFVRTGNLLFVSGQVCVDPEGKLIAKGKLGAGVTVEQGNAAARGCAINLLAQIKAALGDLDKVVRVVRLGGFVNSAPDFLDGPKVLNGASDLMVAAFGDKGRHARTTVGVAALPSRCGGRSRGNIRGLVAERPDARTGLADGAAGRPSRPARPQRAASWKTCRARSRPRSTEISPSRSTCSSPPMARRWCTMTTSWAASPKAPAHCST